MCSAYAAAAAATARRSALGDAKQLEHAETETDGTTDVDADVLQTHDFGEAGRMPTGHVFERTEPKLLAVLDSYKPRLKVLS